MSALLEIRDLGVRRLGRTVLDRIDLTVAAGEVVGVLGPNGAGKTSLLRAAVGVWDAAAGAVKLGGRCVADLGPTEKAKAVGYLPQERRLAWNVAAIDVAALGALDLPTAEARDTALAALSRVGLADLADRGVLDISGGERARVLLARLFATRAPLLVADEPVAGLDPDAQLLILELLRGHARAGGGVLLTLHDLALAARYCDRLVVLGAGRIAAAGTPTEALTDATLAEVFGLAGGLIDTAAGPVLAARRLERTP